MIRGLVKDEIMRYRKLRCVVPGDLLHTSLLGMDMVGGVIGGCLVREVTSVSNVYILDSIALRLIGYIELDLPGKWTRLIFNPKELGCLELYSPFNIGVDGYYTFTFSRFKWLINQSTGFKDWSLHKRHDYWEYIQRLVSLYSSLVNNTQADWSYKTQVITEINDMEKLYLPDWS